MKIAAGILFALLLALQYRLWIAPDGMREVWRIKAEIERQFAENGELEERNRTLAAEVLDLKKGRTALEERARTDLGMIGANETFFQVGADETAVASVTADPPIDEAPPLRAAVR
ncbi:MAG TPA: cell division protein FtsB [Steroidobacteraceae bacterium]|nr:cell division protein FtsB [Steroidobacteraceae bacterium]